MRSRPFITWEGGVREVCQRRGREGNLLRTETPRPGSTEDNLASCGKEVFKYDDDDKNYKSLTYCLCVQINMVCKY